MKNLLVIFGMLTASAVGQNGFITVIPDRPVFFQVNDSWAWVRGHWVGPDMVGPTVSEISCNHSAMTCTDTQATIYANGATFSLDSNQDEYTVERWDKKAIVASNVGGICRVRNVIKFDLEEKRIYYMQTLSEPTEDLPKLSQDICKFVNMRLELKDSTMWRR